MLERKRPSYEPDKDFVRRLREQSGKSVFEIAKDCDCGERTWRNMEAGIRVDAETLKVVATKLKLPHWHDLLSDAERKLLGLGPRIAPLGNAPAPIPGPSATASVRTSHLFQLPAVLTDFTGRKEQVRDLASRFRGVGGKIGLSALRGMGGVGKTSLAVRVAHEVKDHYPDAQLFLPLRGTADGVKEIPMTASEAMARIIHAFHPEMAALPDDEQELASIYRGVLAGKRALIVLDNAKSEAQVRTLLTAPPPVAFLITSRNSQALDGVSAVEVGMMPSDEAYSLLRSIIAAKGSREELATIADLCGQLPLGLRVAGDFLRLKDDWPVAQYILALQRERLRWLRIGDDPAKNVEAVLKLSSAQLVRDSVDRATRWHILHIFQGDFDLAAAAAAWDANENDLGVLNDLSDMTNRSLVLYDRAAGRYRLHDLMKPIAEGLFG